MKSGIPVASPMAGRQGATRATKDLPLVFVTCTDTLWGNRKWAGTLEGTLR